jgi:hypothetical protein
MSEQERPYAMDTGWHRGINSHLDGEALYRWAVKLEAEITRLTAENERLTKITSCNEWVLMQDTHDLLNRALIANVSLTAKLKQAQLMVSEYRGGVALRDEQLAAMTAERDEARNAARSLARAEYPLTDCVRRWPWLDENNG